MKTRVIARAYADEPLDRLAVGSGDGLVYIVNPSLSGTDKEIAMWSIGFPKNAIYEFDKTIYDKILAAFQSSTKDKLAELWKLARPLKTALPDIDAIIEAA
jgi:hypothetical protein